MPGSAARLPRQRSRRLAASPICWSVSPVEPTPDTVDGLTIVNGTPALVAVAWTTASASIFEAS
jgi:hypothetical protein